MAKEKILVVSYVFPPYPGIGGRRWTKFAKYFSREGFEVHVICATNTNAESSVWVDDVIRDNNIHVNYVDAFYPKVLESYPVSLLKKIQYRFWSAFMHLKFKGYIYDKSIFSCDEFLNKTEEVLQREGINKVIVTGAPFRLVHTIVANRFRWPGVHITADFRDPWTWERPGPFERLSSKRFEFEKNMEKGVIEKADLITVPTLPMKQFLMEHYRSCSSKMMELPHAWDEDEIQLNVSQTSASRRLIMFGTLYPGIEEQVDQLADALRIADGKIILDIYSGSQRYSEIFRRNGASRFVTYHTMLPSKELFSKISEYDAAVIINNDSDKDHISTKFIELAASGTPVIYMAGDGKAADFIRSNNAGWHIEENQLTELFTYLLSNHYKKPRPQMNFNDFSFRSISRQFLYTAYHKSDLAVTR